MEKIGVGESNSIEQDSGDDKLQFKDTPELRERLACYLRGYYPSLVMNILYGDLNKVNEEINIILVRLNRSLKSMISLWKM